MATATRPLSSVPVEKIAEHADSVRPGVIIVAVITAFFFGIGWIVGAAWRAVVFCCLAVRYGYRQGAHVTVAPAAAPPAELPVAGKGGEEDRNKARGKGDPATLKRLAKAQATLKKIKAAQEKRKR